MRKILFIAVILFITTTQYAYAMNLDPVFISEFAESLGTQIEFHDYTGKVDFTEYKGAERGIIHFDSVINGIGDSLFGIILILNVPDGKIGNLLVNPVKISDYIYTGYADYGLIIALSNSTRVRYVDMSKPMFQSSDSGALLISVPDMYNNGFSGNGVLAGIVDCGIETDLDIFKKGSQSRFLTFWNQHDNSGGAPYPFNYGREISQNDIFNYNVQDSIGHGTAVLSVLASNELVNGGILRDADIAAVNCQLNTKAVIDGMKYIVDYADNKNLPLALCIPLNHFWGRHDSSSSLDIIINHLFQDNLNSRGIAVPAGNLGGSYLHFGEFVAVSDTGSGFLSNPFALLQCIDDYRLDFDIVLSEDVYFRFTIIENGIISVSKWIDPAVQISGYNSDKTFKYGFDLPNRHLHCMYDNSNNAKIVVEFASDGCMADGYVAQGGYAVPYISEQGMIIGDNINSIAVPGTASQSISAGAFVSRKYVNEAITSPDSIFSIPAWNPSTSSSYCQYVKPDVYAPGKYIVAYDIIGNPEYRFAGNSSAFRGSSFSSAFAAGALGLLLEAEPGISVNRLYGQIIDGVKPVSRLDQNYVPYGFIDVYNSYLTTAVGRFNADISFLARPEGIIEIIINSGTPLSKCRVLKNKNEFGIRYLDNNRVLDIHPLIGNNYYEFYLIDILGREKVLSEMFSYSELYMEQLVIYDLSGRIYRSIPERSGIFFKKYDNKIVKILKF